MYRYRAWRNRLHGDYRSELLNTEMGRQQVRDQAKKEDGFDARRSRAIAEDD